MVGEVVSATLTRASATSLTTATPKNVTSITIQPGSWTLTSQLGFVLTSAATSQLWHSISAVSATKPSTATATGVQNANGEINSTFQVAISSGTLDFSIAPLISEINISAATTYYLVAEASFTGTGVTAFGSLVARRKA
jgi:hypothetical protein